VDKALRLIHGGSDYKGFEEVDLVIEAVPEDVGIKKRVFQKWIACASQRLFLPVIPLPFLSQNWPVSHNESQGLSECIGLILPM